MKKMFVFGILISLTILLSSCSRISRVENRFIDAGYEYSEETSYVAEMLLIEFEAEEIEVTIYGYNKPSKVAIIIDFEDKDDIDKSLDTIVVLQNLTSKYEIDDIRDKNLLVIPIATTEAAEKEIIDIFKN